MTALIANATTRSTAAEYTMTEWVDQNAIEAIYSARVMRPLMANRSLAGKATNTINVPVRPSLTAASVAETADLVNTAINPTEVSASVGEIGIMTTVTDALSEDDIWAGLAEYGNDLGNAVADKMDADSAALLASFSNTTGTTGTALTLARFVAAFRALEARDAPKPYAAVLHPVQYGQLTNDILANGGNWATGVGDSRLGSQAAPGYAGRWFNVDVYTTTNVTDDATDYSGGIFSTGRALMFIGKREARTEFERDASFRLTEIVVSARYAVVELVDTWGQELLSGMTA